MQQFSHLTAAVASRNEEALVIQGEFVRRIQKLHVSAGSCLFK